VPVLIASILIADAMVVIASQARGKFWADEICRNALGMCADLRWPLLAGIVLGGMLLVMRIAR
jgi:hypothetical protein